MSSSQAGWWSATVATLTFAILVGCDVPTGDTSPSINTDTEISTPLVQEKTFSFLGGPESEYDPLIDTTSSDFDSLFTVGQEGDIGIVQNIDDFDIGALDEALDEAGGDLAISDQFSENLIANSDLVNQDIAGSYKRTNDVYESSDQSPLPPAPLPSDTDGDDEITVPFPAPNTSTDDILEAPNFGAVDASSATVKSVTITDESLAGKNEISFTITNNSSSTTLDDGDGNPPRIRVEGIDGNSSQQSFGNTVSPGGTENATVDVSALTLGDGAQYRLFVSSTDASLEVDISAWGYQAATLSDATKIDISASSPSSVSTVGSGASNFEGLNVNSGTLTLDVERDNPERNDGTFDPSINSLDVTNGSTASFANVNNFDTGNRTENEIDMAGNGIAKTVNVNTLTLSPTSSEITIGAADVYTITIDGGLNIETMFFRPNGETIQTSGEVQISNDQLTFNEQNGDFVEISNALIEATNLTVDPEVDFDTLAFSYPDLRRRDADGDGNLFEADDSLEVRFVDNPDGPFEFDRANLESGFDVPLQENLRIQPSSASSIEFTVFGRLESDPNAEAIVNVNDGISATTSVGDFEIQEIDVSKADRFTVEVTSDENDDGQLDLGDDNEVETASFDGFEGISSRVDGLELADVNLDFSVATKNLASTKVQLYTAILGRSDNASRSNVYLTGTSGTNRGVSSSDLSSFETGFVNTAGSDPGESLVGFEVDRENDNLGERVNPPPLSIDDDNSNVSDFVNALPTEIRFAGLAEMNADGGDLQLRKPLELDAGFTLEIPLRIRDRFVVRDTIDADLSDLNDLTNPEEDVNLSKAELQFSYTNGLPLGADVKMTVVDDRGSTVRTFNENFKDDAFRIEPAQKNNEGAAERPVSGEFVFNLGRTQADLRDLATGREIQLELKMDQEGTNEGSTTALFQADDQLTLNRVRLDVDASVQTGN